MEKIKGYMCFIDWNYELGNAAGGTLVYASINDLKDNHKCWEECGIVEVLVERTKLIDRGTLFKVRKEIKDGEGDEKNKT